ncbi:uncharacterized protein METZ01_LOCUS87433, partial [marine metagenome]
VIFKKAGRQLYHHGKSDWHLATQSLFYMCIFGTYIVDRNSYPKLGFMCGVIIWRD